MFWELGGGWAIEGQTPAELVAQVAESQSQQASNLLGEARTETLSSPLYADGAMGAKSNLRKELRGVVRKLRVHPAKDWDQEICVPVGRGCGECRQGVPRGLCPVLCQMGKMVLPQGNYFYNV